MSDNSVYGLGTLELRLADLDLELRLSSEVKIAASEKDERDDASRTYGLTAKPFHGHGHWKPWVVKSHGYQLILDLYIAPELTHDEKAYAQHIAAKLKQLKIWESLGLDVTSIETRPNNTRAASWTIFLDYSERTSSSEKAKLHKLAPELPYHDIKPPPGIRVIKVEAVHVKMLLRDSPAAKVLKPVSGKQDHADSGKEDLTFDGKSLFCSMDAVYEEQLCPSGYAGTDDVDHMHNPSLVPDNLEQRSSNTSAAESLSAYLTPPPSQETKEDNLQDLDIEPMQQTTHCVSTETIMTSLETGLRHVMCKAPSRNSKIHTITSNEDFDCLPIIAPALWVPDYHKSLSERAVFLPTISHAIANVSGHSSAGLGLKLKAWQLSHRHPHKGREMFSARADLDRNKVQEAVSVDLWAAMASGLSNARTAKQSRLLRDFFKSTHEADEIEDAEHMLDEVATDYRSDTTWDESDFKDLLDMASEADDGSICNLAVGDIGDVCSSPWTEAPTDRLPDRWNPEHPSPLDHQLDLFDDCTELYDADRRGVLGPGAGKDGGSFGTHREIGHCWSGSYLAHDSEVLQFPKTAGAEPDADDMLL